MTGEPRKGPTRRRVVMPEMEQLPRVGKIRLGEQVEKTRETGGSITYPSKIDYFRVEAEESGVTSPEAAASFHEVYGDEPRSLRCALPGPTPDAVFEGAWRLYGANKLKRLCDGTTCDERTATGGWTEQPCICAGLPKMVKRKGKKEEVPNPDLCKLTWTFNVLLPDVRGIGVWQVDTGSEISIRRISSWLQMMHRLIGDFTLTEFTLDLVEAMVAPEGKALAVYVLQPRSEGSSPRELLAGGGRAERQLIEAGPVPDVPPPVVDEGPPPDVDPETGEVIEPSPSDAAVADGDSTDPSGDDAPVGDRDAGDAGGEPAPPPPESELLPGGDRAERKPKLGDPQPPGGSYWDRLWQERLRHLRDLGLSSDEVAELAAREGVVNAWDLCVDEAYSKVEIACVARAEAKSGATA